MAVERYYYRDIVPFSAMIIMECMNVGLNTLFKTATLSGMSYRAFVVYAYAVAALFISRRSLPFSVSLSLLHVSFSLCRFFWQIKSASSTQFLHILQNWTSWAYRVQSKTKSPLIL